MKFFIDTANLDQIREAQNLGVLDGVTTNPSLMAKEGITGRDNILQHYRDICEIVDGDVSAEVIATDFDNMIAEGTELANLHSQIVVKLPMIKDGVKAAKYFSDKGIKTNVTLVFSLKKNTVFLFSVCSVVQTHKTNNQPSATDDTRQPEASAAPDGRSI